MDMDMDKEKAMLEQNSDCHARVSWLVHQIVEEFGECPPDRKPGWLCRDEDGCINCWIAASGRAVNKVKQNGKS
jgi:hypothetical protein